MFDGDAWNDEFWKWTWIGQSLPHRSVALVLKKFIRYWSVSTSVGQLLQCAVAFSAQACVI